MKKILSILLAVVMLQSISVTVNAREFYMEIFSSSGRCAYLPEEEARQQVHEKDDWYFEPPIKIRNDYGETLWIERSDLTTYEMLLGWKKEDSVDLVHICKEDDTEIYASVATSSADQWIATGFWHLAYSDEEPEEIPNVTLSVFSFDTLHSISKDFTLIFPSRLSCTSQTMKRQSA